MKTATFFVVGMVLLLFSSDGQPVYYSGLMEEVKKTVTKMISLYGSNKASVIINLNCDLDMKFSRDLVTSHFTMHINLSEWVLPYDRSRGATAAYTRVFLTELGKDRFYLALPGSAGDPR